jgi:hypothetical protein
MNKKNLLIGVFLFVLIGTAFIQYRNSIPQKKVVAENHISVKQTVLVDGSKKESTQKVRLGTTALQLLRNSYKIVTKGEGKNAFITTIEERTASDTEREFWAFYVNGKQATVGAGSYYLKNSDTIEWKIETY